MNEEITDTNNIEYSRKTINTILTDKVLCDSVLSTADTASLEYIFSQHWIVAGDAVYDAAAILNKEYHIPSIALRNMHTMLNHLYSKNDTLININPNPSSGKIWISGINATDFKVEINDQAGRAVLSVKNENELDLNWLSAGFYHLKILYENKIISNKKLIIQK